MGLTLGPGIDRPGTEEVGVNEGVAIIENGDTIGRLANGDGVVVGVATAGRHD
jgi:hypothetical protein